MINVLKQWIMACWYRLLPSQASRCTCREMNIQIGDVYASVEVTTYQQHGIQQWTVFSETPFRLSNLHGEDDGDAVSRDENFYTSTITLPIDVIPLIVAKSQEVQR